MERSWVDAEDVGGSGGDVLRRVGQEFEGEDWVAVACTDVAR